MLLDNEDVKFVKFSLNGKDFGVLGCGYRLRTKPRNLKYKAKLRARVEADSIEAEANFNLGHGERTCSC